MMIIMEEKDSSNTVLHAVDIRAAKRKRRIQPVGEIIGTWVGLLPQIYPHNPRYPGRYSVAGWPVATTWGIRFYHDDLL